MLPVQPINDEANHGRGDAVLLGQSSLLAEHTSVGGADCTDVILGKFAVPIGCAAMISAPAATLTIQGVIKLGTRPEVCGIAARRVVAAVKNKRCFRRDGAIGQVERNAMSKLGRVAFAATTNDEHPVSGSIRPTSPKPTCILAPTTVNPRPKPLDLPWGNIELHVTLHRDVPRRGLLTQCPGFSFPEQLYQIWGAT